MTLNVAQRGLNVATFRWIEVRLMEMLATWVPSTPEMEAKLVFGAHIWDVAQHADALGKRTHELRLPEQHSVRPVTTYAEFVDEVVATTDTAKRVAGLYDCLLPGLDARFRAYLDQVDLLLDAPTVRIIERILTDTKRMVAEADEMRAEVPAARLDEPRWLFELAERQASVPDVVAEPAVSQA
jgi:hypothetical protein